MHLVHKIYKHKVTRSESVTGGRPIIQRSYELKYWLEKNIIVGNLNANIGKEERDISVKWMELTWGVQQQWAESHWFAINLPRRYTRKYSDLQITCIRDVRSCRGVKCDICPLSGPYDEVIEKIKLQEFMAGIMESKLENYCRREMQWRHTAGCPQIMQMGWD
jgi:hypothetical protein